MIDPISSDKPGVRPLDRITVSQPGDPSQTSKMTMTPTEGAKQNNEFDVEQWDLSPENMQKIQFAKIQYHLAYVALSAINTLAERADPTEKLSIQDISGKVQEIVGISLVSPAAGNAFSGRPPSGHSAFDQSPSIRTLSEKMVIASESGKAGAASEAKSDDMSELMSLLDYFSPEKTSQRLLDATAILFNAGEIAQSQNKGDSCRSFFGAIGKAIDEAFTQVLQRFGKLPEAVQIEVDKTHSLIFSGLQTFTEKGLDAESSNSDGAVMAKLDAFCRESAHCFERLERTFARGGYNTHGMFHLISTATFSKKG